MRAQGDRRAALFIGWILAILQCGSLLFAALWLAARPWIFDHYYASLVRSPSPKDAHEIAVWLNSNRSQEALAAAVTQGHLSERELSHYADVRAELGKVPFAFFLCASAFITLYLARRRLTFLPTIQWCALATMLVIVCVCTGLAIWNWRLFFGWIHYPLFGATSWRFPRGSYSLQLFPVGFWRATGITVVLPALLTPGVILLWSAGTRRRFCSLTDLPAGESASSRE